MTDAQLTSLLTRLLDPVVGIVYDPAAGSAMVLAEAWRRRQSPDVQLLGQEVSEFNWKLGYLHLALCKAKYELLTGDTILQDRFRSLQMDRIAADPPFGLERRVSDQPRDERWQFSAMPKSSEWLWAQHVLFHLNEVGLGVVTMPPTALFRSGDAAARIGLAESGFLDAVIDLPQGIATGFSAGLALLVFAKSRRNRANKVLFINARQLGKPRRGKSHELSNEDLDLIQEALESWRRGNFRATPLFAGSATTEEIRRNRGDLSPQRYVRYVTPVSDSDREDVRARIHDAIARLHRTTSSIEPSIETLRNASECFSLSSTTASQIVKLGDVLISQPLAGTRQDLDGEGDPIPYVQTSLVSRGDGHLDEPPKELSYQVPRSRRARVADLLLVSRGLGQNSGGCSVIDFDGEVGYAQSLVKLSIDSTRVDPNYIRLYLTSSRGRDALSAATTGSVIGNLRVEALEQLEIPLPPLSIQHKISAAMNQLEHAARQLRTVGDESIDVIDALRDAIAIGAVIPTGSRTASQ